MSCERTIDDPTADLSALAVRTPDAGTLIVGAPSGETCVLSVVVPPPERVEVEGWVVTGPALHIVRIGPEGSWLAGESIASIARDGVEVLRMHRPGPVEIRRLPDASVLIGTTEGLVLDASWAPVDLDRLHVLDADRWVDAGQLRSPLVLGPDEVDRLQQRSGHAWIWVRMVRS